MDFCICSHYRDFESLIMFLTVAFLMRAWWLSASFSSLCRISSCFVFVNTAVQFSRAQLWIELLLMSRMLLFNLHVSCSCRLADRHPGVARCRCSHDSGGLFGGRYFPVQGHAKTTLPHCGNIPLHCRYVTFPIYLFINSFTFYNVWLITQCFSSFHICLCLCSTAHIK